MGLYSDYTELPWLWKPFQNMWFAWSAAIVVPVVLATLLGLLVFKRRIRGPYFAILTQAMALVFWLLLVGQLQLTAGTNGLTNFSKTFGRNKFAPDTPEFLYRLALVGLLVVIAIGWILMRSRYGKLLTAVRDGEDRVRFLGYDPALVKTIGFAVAAGMAGLAGALERADHRHRRPQPVRRPAVDHHGLLGRRRWSRGHLGSRARGHRRELDQDQRQ